MADAALLLYEVPPKSHGVDDRSPGQTRRSAQKLEKLDGKPGRITNFGAGPIASTAAGGESHTETNPNFEKRYFNRPYKGHSPEV